MCLLCLDVAAEEDKKLFGHMFDDMGPDGGSPGEADGSDGDLLSSGESGDDDEGEEEEGWSDDDVEEGLGAGQLRRDDPDELDELFGQVGGAGGQQGRPVQHTKP